MDLGVATSFSLPTSMTPLPKESSSKGADQLEVAVPVSEDVGSVLSLNEVTDRFHEVHHPSALSNVQPSAALCSLSDLNVPRHTRQRVEGPTSATMKNTHAGTFASENLQKPDFAEDLCKFAAVNDGGKGCWALILTGVMLAKFKDMCSMTAEVERLNKKHVASTSQAYKEGIHVQKLVESDDATKGPTIQQENEKEIDKAQTEFERVSNERDLFGQHLNDEKQRLFACQETILSTLRTALIKGGLLDGDEDSEKERNDDDSMKDGVDPHQHDQHQDNHQTDSTLVLSDARSTIPEARHRRAIADKCIDTEKRLNKLQRELEDRRFMNYYESMDYQIAVDNGGCSVSKSEFDKQELSKKMKLTRKILEVEDEYTKAVAEKMALSIASNDIKLESAMNLGDEEVESPKHEARRLGIEAWRNGVTGGKEQEAPEYSLEDTIWKVKTVGVGEDCYWLDMDVVCGRRIEKYREECEKLREGVLLQKMSSEAGLPVEQLWSQGY